VNAQLTKSNLLKFTAVIKPQGRDRHHKIPPLQPLLDEFNSVHILLYFCKIYFNIILLGGLLPYGFLTISPTLTILVDE